jgi:hypothetical protein
VFKTASLNLLAILALVPVVSASGSTNDPAWRSIQPKRIPHIVAEADAKNTSNLTRRRNDRESEFWVRRLTILLIFSGQRTASTIRIRESDF